MAEVLLTIVIVLAVWAVGIFICAAFNWLRSGPPVKSNAQTEIDWSEPSDGIQFLNKKPGLVSLCAMCGEEIKHKKPLRCRDCKTAYHKACWDFMHGECIVYGCEGRRLVRRKSTREVARSED